MQNPGGYSPDRWPVSRSTGYRKTGPQAATVVLRVRAGWIVQAVVNDQVIATSDDTVLVEGNHYFPLESVRPGVLHMTRTKSVCPWKGVAGYYPVEQDGVIEKDAAWTYRHPAPFARRIKDRVACWGSVRVVDHG